MVLIEELPEDEQVPGDQQTEAKDPQPPEQQEPTTDAKHNEDEKEWVHVGHTDAGSSPSSSSKANENDLEGDHFQAAQQTEEAPSDPALDQEMLKLSEELKQQGNTLFKAGDIEQAIEKYTGALEAAPATAKERSVYFGNRAACLMRLEDYAEAAQDCTAALDIDETYSKVWLRRATAFEALDDLERALSDVKKAIEVDPGNTIALAMAARLEPVVNERREKMKEEMMGKLKELGNTVLGKFGMSLDNFKAEQDPNTGSYSIKFQQ